MDGQIGIRARALCRLEAPLAVGLAVVDPQRGGIPGPLPPQLPTGTGGVVGGVEPVAAAGEKPPRLGFHDIRPAFMSASIAICLPGIASRVKRAPTSAIRPAPLVITTKSMTTRIDEHDHADHVVAADEEVAERLDHLARGGRAGVALEEDDAGRGDVVGRAGAAASSAGSPPERRREPSRPRSSPIRGSASSASPAPPRSAGS